jgi:hypothetical protein
MRADADKGLDAALLLYIVKGAAPIYGRTKLQKTTFLVELRLKESDRVGPHFRFIRYVNGPFSGQLWNLFDELAEAGFVSKTTFELTDRGRFLIDLVIPELHRHPKNRAALKIMDDVIGWCRPRHGAGLIKYVYQLEVVPDEMPGERMKVEDVPFGSEIIHPPPGGLKLSPDTQLLLKEELELTDKDLKRAERRLPEIERQAIRNLSEALSADARV